jgi:pSer/pThr/pTyr-binding forkhead associated (FHA) protein
MEPKAFTPPAGGEPGLSLDAHLWVCSGKNVGRRFSLDRAEQLIGRSPDVDILMLDERVSQQHAQIILREGRHWILDLGSTNGTFVNNDRIVEAKLRDGDLIQVGETVCEYLSYEERKLTITLRGTDRESDAVPEALRMGAQLALRAARDTRPIDAIERDEGPRHMIALDHERMQPILRPAKSVGPMVSAPTDTALSEALRPHAVIEGYEGDVGIAHAGVGQLDEVFAQAERIVQFFRPYALSILLLTMLGTATGLTIYEVFPPAQKAMFEVSLNPSASENPLVRDRGSSIAFFRSAEQNFMSASTIERTLQELGVGNISAELIGEVQERLEFASAGPPVPNTYRGSYKAKPPEDPVRFLETHVRLYLDAEIEKTLKAIRLQIDFLSAQLSEEEKNLRRTESELLEFKKDNIDGLPEQAAAYYALLFDLEKQRSEVNINVVKTGLEERITTRRLKEEAPMIESRATSFHPFQDRIVATRGDLAEARASGKDSEHPDVVRLEQKLEQLLLEAKNADTEKEVERRRNPIYDTVRDRARELEVERQVASTEAGRLEAELERVRAIVRRLPELEAMYTELTRNYSQTQQTYERLLEQKKVTEMQLELEKASAAARYDIISPPYADLPSRPKKLLIYGGVGFGIGLVLGLVSAVTRRLQLIARMVELLRSKAPSVPGTKLQRVRD